MPRPDVTRRAATGNSPEDANGAGGVQSVEIAARILKALAEGGGVLALKDVALAAGMARGKVHRYLVSLKRSGLVAQDEKSGKYGIGPAAVTVGLVGLRGMSPVRAAYDALPALRDRVGETVTMAIWGEMGPTIIAMEEGGQAVTMNVRVGSVIPLLTTAIGRVFAAYLPAPVTRDFVAAERAKPRPGVATPDAAETARLLDEVRTRRMARIDGTLLPGIAALAAPAFDYREKLIGVVCVLGRSESLDAAWEGAVARALADAVSDVSRRLGYAAGGC
jgi:DNA-binding IclR family transcriptional regulator